MLERRSFIVFSTADWSTRYWTNKQHNTRLLAERGHDVLYVESIGLRRAHLNDRRDLGRLWRRLLSGLRSLVLGPRRVAPHIYVLSPLSLPWGRRYAGVRKLNQALLQHALRRFRRRHAFGQPEIWSYHPFVLDLVDPPYGPLVYVAVDDLAALPGIDGTAFRAAERRLVRSCDVVFATSRLLVQRYRPDSDNVHFISNVVDIEHFVQAFAGGEPADLGAIPRPRLGFHGVLSDQKLDLDLLETLMSRRPEWQLVLIGDAREGQDPRKLDGLRGLGNVHFLGAKDYAMLPSYLSGFDVGLLPLATNPYTIAMFPMKLYEYLAAGVPVVSTKLPYTAEVGVEQMMTADGADQFANAIVAQLARGRFSVEAAKAAVGEHTYLERLDSMLAITAKAWK